MATEKKWNENELEMAMEKERNRSGKKTENAIKMKWHGLK